MSKTIEFRMGRSVGVWLDGKEPDGRWDIEEGDGDTEFGTPRLVVGGVKISKFEFPVSIWDMETPQSVEVTLDGVVREGRLVGSVLGCEDEVREAVLVNGEKVSLDETQAYFRFEFWGK